MKLENRERVDGTCVTIGHRVYRSNGAIKVSKRYSAEYRDPDGKQRCEGLATTNRAQARRLAIELQQRLETGGEKVKPSSIAINTLADEYLEITKAKGVAPKTVWKYRADLNKLKEFCRERKLELARRFTENDLYRFRQHLVDAGYADKTVQGVLVLTKQLFKWAWRQRLLPDYRLEAASFPKAKARPQPCFTSSQVDALIVASAGEEKLAFALMGYAGLRIGEVEQLRSEDIQHHDNQPAMLHIRRGGSNGSTKDHDDRFVPIHPQVADLIPTRRRSRGVLLPTITQRSLLDRLKALCAVCGFDNPSQYKLHSFRHHFASLCANHGVAHRKALAWLGHSSSEMLDLYYHLHDDDSRQTMMELARSHASSEDRDSDPEGSLRATGESKTVGSPQDPDIQDLVDCLLNETEGVGFEPTVRLPAH